MALLSEPIVIAAIAAGGMALLVLITAAAMYLYRRAHPYPNPLPYTPSPNLKSNSSSSSRSKRHPDDHAPVHTPISADSQSINPYLTPTVPRVQPPPSPHRRTQTQTPSHFDYAILDSPETRLTPSSAGSKLRKTDSPRAGTKQSYPYPDTPDSQQPMISPSIPNHRGSMSSSVMFITYDQGLAKLGLSPSPRPPPSALTPSTGGISLPSAISAVELQTPRSYPTPSRGRRVPVAVYREEEGESSLVAETPRSGRTIEEGYRQPRAGRRKEGREDAPDSEAFRGNEAWLPSYYPPAGDRYDIASDKKSRWGGKI